jgi:D-alanyl-D-alanine carboxypeptidase
VALLVVGAAVVIVGPLRRTASPVAGLDARLSDDGRLLGHFPYPEARPEQLAAIAPGLQLRPEAAESLRTLQRDAQAEGVRIQVLSAFRPVEPERNQSALTRAQVSAPPGYSEHSTGYAVDLGDATRPDLHLNPAFDATAAFRWLKANAHRYHFQMSFPRDNPQGVSYEPWHWRYEGSTTALRLFEPAQRFAR